VKRRDFIAGLGSAAAWPVATRGQQRIRVPVVGVMMGWSESDPIFRSLLDAFVQELARLGWMEGRNVQIAQRWTNSDIDRTRIFAKELVGLKPDVIFAATTTPTAALQLETRTIPIVFSIVADPVGMGFVADLRRPGGNITGFAVEEAAMAGKWLQMIKEIAPHVGRAAAMYNPDTAPFAKYFLGPFEAAARALAVAPTILPVRDDAEIETAIESLGQERGGLVIVPDIFMVNHRIVIISAAARSRVPTILDTPSFPRDGGLMSYGASFPVLFRQAAGYVDRILKGDKAADLPVQVPTKYDLVINLKTAKVLGLTVPQSILVGADEVIE
jgi:putative tryptophan/tyrosine transport system substrate-binding protein